MSDGLVDWTGEEELRCRIMASGINLDIRTVRSNGATQLARLHPALEYGRIWFGLVWFGLVWFEPTAS